MEVRPCPQGSFLPFQLLTQDAFQGGPSGFYCGRHAHVKPGLCGKNRNKPRPPRGSQTKSLHMGHSTFNGWLSKSHGVTDMAMRP